MPPTVLLQHAENGHVACQRGWNPIGLYVSPPSSSQQWSHPKFKSSPLDSTSPIQLCCGNNRKQTRVFYLQSESRTPQQILVFGDMAHDAAQSQSSRRRRVTWPTVRQQPDSSSSADLSN
ncbi:uncharacterized [Tachysurus ichikawai]